jgi:ABC-type transporter Mla MlaB component
MPARHDPGVLVLAGRIGAGDVSRLAAGLPALLGSGSIVCDVQGLTGVDARTVDSLARLQLAARRLGCRLVLRNPSAQLDGLLALAGLQAAMRTSPPRRRTDMSNRTGEEQG